MYKEEIKKILKDYLDITPSSPKHTVFIDYDIAADHISSRLDALVILPKPNPTCENCKYYQDVSNGWGYCKFNPPFTKKEQRQKYCNGEYSNLIEDVLHTEWTKVSDCDWCGQFEQREA